MPSSRRQLLASIGLGIAGVAGCSTGPGTGTTPDDPSETPTGTPAETPSAATFGESVTVDGTSITVSNLVDTHSFLYLSAPDAFGVEVADGQFAFVTIEASGDGPPAPERFEFVYDDQRRSAETYRAYGPAGDLPVGRTEYSTDEPKGYLGFEIPAPLDAEEVGVALGDARWTVPESDRPPLRSPPPSFTVEYDVPDAVAHDEPISLSLSVTNEGEGDGTFRGAINHQGPMYGASDIVFPLAAGASETHEETVDYHLQADLSTDRLQFAIVTAGGGQSFEVRIEGGGTATAGTTTP